jgi:hypothetical protein
MQGAVIAENVNKTFEYYKIIEVLSGRALRTVTREGLSAGSRCATTYLNINIRIYKASYASVIRPAQRLLPNGVFLFDARSGTACCAPTGNSVFFDYGYRFCQQSELGEKNHLHLLLRH